MANPEMVRGPLLLHHFGFVCGLVVRWQGLSAKPLVRAPWADHRAQRLQRPCDSQTRFTWASKPSWLGCL